jgi:hypothetical protein
VRPPPAYNLLPDQFSFHPATSAKHISKQTPGTASSSSSPLSSPSQHSLHPKALSDNSRHPLHNSRAPNHSQSPNRRRNGNGSHAQRAYSLGDRIGKCGTKRVRRGWRAGDGKAGIRPRRRSGCTRFPLTPVCFLHNSFPALSLFFFFSEGGVLRIL